ncbi:C6 transcription factor [Penicillium daleae]|uniref:C6 transcription factor n=1 Tax=Penicillium daleae TaxID=63821 RepID=A0AAD6BVK1_9EURO|nr:C6 transcription factor [Penicillium daleae]KAJ5433672.1 C6 transcription factor [Penicillium daleae]
MSKTGIGNRPYRSHKVRACDTCRKRKARCTVDIPHQPCITCRVQGTNCLYEDSFRGEHLKRPSIHKVTETLQSPAVAKRDSKARTLWNRELDSIFMIGPMEAEDAHVIDAYISQENSDGITNGLSTIYPSIPNSPALDATVPPKPHGGRVRGPPGEAQRDTLQHIIGPIRHDLVRLFVKQFNAAFPCIEIRSFWNSYIADRTNGPSSSLLCQIYSASLQYWKYIPGLSGRPKPEALYVFKLSTDALDEDFTEPGISTINAALVNLAVGPIHSVSNRAITCGRMVSLAYCLGLNADPISWNISEDERDQRIRLWWCLLIHDHWGSLAYGVPPHISKGQYDVPIPMSQSLSWKDPMESGDLASTDCFISLCRLTEILGGILPFIFEKVPRTTMLYDLKRLRQILVDLDIWEDSLPTSIKPNECLGYGSHQTIGLNNLRLAFLYTKMLVYRLQFNVSVLWLAGRESKS